MKKTVLLAVLLAFSSSVLASKGPSLDQRLTRLERILQNQSLSDIVLQLQRLQQEVQQLRGEMELQRHELEALENRQRELYLDLDQRLSRTDTPPTEPVPSETAAQPGGAPVSEVPVAAAPMAKPKPDQAAGSASALAKPGDPAKEKPAYQRAFKLLQQGDYPAALEGFRGFVAGYPNSHLADNAQYWLGETSYVTRDFDTALVEFSKVLDQYPSSAKVPGSLLKMGYIHYEKRQWSEAKKVLGRIVREYPNSTEAQLAKSRLERIRSEGR